MTKKKILHSAAAMVALISLGLGFSWLVGGCASRKRPNLLIITVDTLRSDRLGHAGYGRPTSPRIDALAAESVVFSNSWSQSGWTLPSVCTILTGRYPSQHGATDLHWKMNPNLPTLAGILAEEGYDTHAFVSHVILLPRYGMNKGFQLYDYAVLDRGNPHEVATSDLLTDKALRDLESLKEPFFLWIHYFDPHFDYLSHPPWSGFGDSDSDRYDQEIAFTDREIGRLLDGFAQRGLLDRTLVVFTADHGEEFGDHGGVEHETCYEEIVRTTLLIRGPALEPGRIEEPAEQIDLLPTILGLLDVQPVEIYPGRDLFGENPGAPSIFIERDRPPGFRQRAIVRDGIKLIEITETDTLEIPESSRGTHRPVENVEAGIWMFDLREDPRELRNLAAERPEETERLQARLRSHFGGTPARSGPVEIDPELRERLRSLGYIR